MYRTQPSRFNRISRFLVTGTLLLQFNTQCNPNVSGAVLQGLETTSLTFAQVLLGALFDGLGNSDVNQGTLLAGQ